MRKNKYIFSLLVLVVLCGQCLGVRDKLANYDKRGLGISSIDRVLKLNSDEIDLGTAALLVSKNWSGRTNHRKHRAFIDDIAYEILDRLEKKGKRNDIDAIREINSYLYDEMGFVAISDANDPRDLLLDTVIERRQGYCLSLSVLYLAIGERLGLPLYGVVVPGHFFVRYEDGPIRINIETTSAGNTATDEHYIEKFKVPVENGETIYMKTLTNHQVLGCYYNNLGNCYIKNEDDAAARKALEKSVLLAPELSESRNNLGNIYYRQGLLNKAKRQFEEAIKNNPHDAKTYTNLGNVLLSMGQTLRAINRFEKSTKLDDTFKDAYLGLARAYREKKMYSSALKAIDQGLLLNSEPKWWVELALIYRDMGEYYMSIEYLHKALEYDSDMADVYFELALSYGHIKEVDNQILSYKRALELRPDLAGAMQNLGNIYLERDELDEAIAMFAGGAQVEPDNSAFYFGLGLAYARKGEFKKAESYYLKTIKLDRKNETAYYNLAVCYYNMKRYSQALEYAETAQRFGFELPDGLIKEFNRKLKK